MTLNEYIAQTDPQPDVKVVLTEGEYIQRDAIKVTPFSVQTAVDIPAVTQRYGIKDNYIRIGTARQLFTRHPQTGELRGSVFFLPDDAPEPPELTRFLRFLKANEVFLKQWCEEHPVRGDLQEYNARFRTAYAEYLNSIRNTYALTDEDIDFWLL
ncbi:hypothetical protein [Alistipes communis]|uniref:hypothetical protein n=1 Tax=Alistipes communis TaxID=2585118 RepID=UPI003AAD1E27